MFGVERNLDNFAARLRGTSMQIVETVNPYWFVLHSTAVQFCDCPHTATQRVPDAKIFTRDTHIADASQTT